MAPIPMIHSWPPAMLVSFPTARYAAHSAATACHSLSCQRSQDHPQTSRQRQDLSFSCFICLKEVSRCVGRLSCMGDIISPTILAILPRRWVLTLQHPSPAFPLASLPLLKGSLFHLLRAYRLNPSNPVFKTLLVLLTPRNLISTQEQ